MSEPAGERHDGRGRPGRAEPPRHHARPPLLLAVLALAAFAVLCGLGTWQLERLAWKEALIARIASRVDAPPQPLPAPADWAALTPEEIEYRRVAFTARYRHDDEIHVFIALSAPRGRFGGQGYFVVTPADLDDGTVVFVNRGFVPMDRKDPATRAEGQVEGVQAITGLMRPSEQPSWVTPASDPVKNVWFARNVTEMAAASGIDPARVAPFTVDVEAGEAPGGLPQGGETLVTFTNNHLQYAVTWYGLALALVAVTAAYFRRSRAGDRPRD